MRLIALFLLLTLLYTGCNDDDDTSPQGRGLVEGTLKGMRSDDLTPIDETFRSPFPFPNSNEISFSADEQIISVTVEQAGDPERGDNNWLRISFFQDRNESEFDENVFGDTPFYPILDFRFSRMLEGNRRFIFNGGTTFNNVNQFTSFEITNFNIDESRGEISFDFTFVLPGDFNSTGNEATISGSTTVPYIEEVF